MKLGQKFLLRLLLLLSASKLFERRQSVEETILIQRRLPSDYLIQPEYLEIYVRGVDCRNHLEGLEPMLWHANSIGTRLITC